jgi:branched-chain amino acid aminotransferase
VKVVSQALGELPGDAPVFRADDEALLRGACAFETLRVNDGRPFLLAGHLERFRRSIDALALPPAEGVEELVARAIGGDGVLRLYRTSFDIVATYGPLPGGLDEERARGNALRTFDVGAPAALEGVKATSYAASFALRREAELQGADDALFRSGDVVLECATANIWWRHGEALFTPATRPGVLPGVTRGFVCAHEDVREGAFPLDDLLTADEAFTTSSIREVIPVIAVDGHSIGDGRPGPAAARLQAAIRSSA